MMKFLILSLIISILICCKSPQQIGHNQSIDTIISMNEMIEIIDTLSCDAFEGRKTGSEGIEKAAKYIENYFRKFNIRSFYSNYRDSFLIGEIQAYNIIGIIEGKNPDLINEYILLSAHYDHIGKSFGDSDSVYNGANDNASGVSTVLNIARILAENPQNSRNIIIALFSGEEMGLLGSEHFARILKKNGPKLYCAVNVDMIGSQFSKDPGKVYLSGYKKSNMPEIFNRYIGSEEVVQWSKEDMYDLFSLSDNYPIYEALKVPAHTFCTFDFANYKHYHRLSDEIQNIDADNTLIISNHIKTGFIGISKSIEHEIELK